MNTPSPNRPRRWAFNFMTTAFAAALALLYVLVLRTIATQISPPPAPNLEPYPDVSTPAACEAAGGRWVEQSPDKGITRPAPIESNPYCQGPLAFERENEAQLETSRQTSLFVFAIGGGIAVLAGLLIRRLKSVAPGLMLAGIIAFIITTVHVWTLAANIGRLITLIVVFTLVVGAGVYAFKDRE